MEPDLLCMLADTLHICEQGYYMRSAASVDLKLSLAEMEAIRVFLPDEVSALAQFKDFRHTRVMGRCSHGCENMDAFGQMGTAVCPLENLLHLCYS